MQICRSVAPPQASEEELRQAEAEATFTIQRFMATSVMLYLCRPSCFHSLPRRPRHTAANTGFDETHADELAKSPICDRRGQEDFLGDESLYNICETTKASHGLKVINGLGRRLNWYCAGYSASAP